MTRLLCRALGRLFLVLATTCLAFPAAALELKLGLQATGTARWELAAMQALGFDRSHDLTIELREVADSRAGQIALQAGEVDVILSDFVWVSLQRHAGTSTTLVPHSLSVGGLMVDPAAGIAGLADLKGKTIAVSGSPVDKSFVVLAAAYHQATGGVLADDAELRFGAPPLVNELLTTGQAAAALNLWNWNVRAALAGKTELVSIPTLLADLGLSATPPLLGWAFAEDSPQLPAITAFIDASFATKAALLTDDALWEQIRDAMNVGDDDALFVALRDGYRAGLVSGYGPDDVAAATAYFAVIAREGGLDAVGGVAELSPGTFWAGGFR
jgi:NitT/TauT family transport system substrate-binding protein